jgi:ABC-type sugar transport system permease subunit
MRPSLHHCLVAALVLAIAAALAGLGVQRYVSTGQEHRGEEFRALAAAMQLASLLGSVEKAAVTAVVERERPLLEEGGALRLLFVRRGQVVPGLNVSRPASVTVSVGERAEGTDDERLVTLCAGLDRRLAGEAAGPSGPAGEKDSGAGAETGQDGGRGTEAGQDGGRGTEAGQDGGRGTEAGQDGGRGTEAGQDGGRGAGAGAAVGPAGGSILDRVDRRALVWRQGERVVGAWPVVVSGRFLGLAAAEVIRAVPAPSALPAAAGIVAAFLAVFLGMMAWLKKPLVAFVSASVAALLLSALLVARDESAKADAFLAARDSAATLFVNRVLPVNPAAMADLDALWTDVFRAQAEGLDVVFAAKVEQPRSGGEETICLACIESASVASSVALDRAFPTLLVLFLVLAVCSVVFLPLSELVQGMVTMPGTYAYVAPAMAGMVVLVLVPFLMGVGLGFFNTDYEFVGVENFRDILFPSAESDTNFYFTLGVTVLWTVSNVVLHVVIGLFLALILVGQRVRLRGLFRVLLIVPWAVPNYITALVWKWMFTSQMGAINLMLEAVGIEPVSWFGPSFWTNFFAALATNTWLGFPFMMVVSMGALQSIPTEMYEAADMDGASRWQKFRFITLPLLKPALFPAIILGTIWTFNMFNIIFLVTRGRPDNKTNILITEAYRFFAELNQYGVAAAYCVLIFVILLLYTLVTNRVTRATQGAFE